MKSLLLAASAAAAMAFAVPAAAGVVTFDSQATAGIGFFGDGTTYSEGGLTFTSSQTDPQALLHWGTSDGTEIYNADPDGATMLQNYFGHTITITRTGGGSFDLNSIDVADGYNSGAAGSIGYAWVDAGGAHSGSFALDNAAGLQTFALNLADVTSFVIGPQDSPYFQFDNVTFDSVGGVPEASTWALMIAGFGAAGAMVRRRKAAIA